MIYMIPKIYKKMQTNTNRYEKMQKDTTIYQKYDLYDPTMYKKVPKNSKMYKKTYQTIPKATKDTKHTRDQLIGNKREPALKDWIS